jgi:hypothetical protein
MHRPECLALELARHGVSAICVGIDDSQEPNGLALEFEFFVYARVVASKDAYADHSDRNRIMRSQKTFSTASCREEL